MRRRTGAAESGIVRSGAMWSAMGTATLGAGAALFVYKRWLAPRIFGSAAESYRQAEALVNLGLLLRPANGLPPLGGWAISAEIALYLVEKIRETKPAVIVELGSGSSTMILALAVERFAPDARLISVEQDEEYAAEVAGRVAAWPQVSVRHAALVNGWYDRSALSDIRTVDLLIVDGPRGQMEHPVREPALPYFADKLNKRGVVVLDDAARKAEQVVIERWREAFPDLSVTTVGSHKGAAVFQFTSEADGSHLHQ